MKFISVHNEIHVEKIIPISRIREIRWVYKNDRRVAVVTVDGEPSSAKWFCSERDAVDLTVQRIPVQPGVNIDGGFPVLWVERCDGNDTAFCWHAEDETIHAHEIYVNETFYIRQADEAIEQAAERATAEPDKKAANEW